MQRYVDYDGAEMRSTLDPAKNALPLLQGPKREPGPLRERTQKGLQREYTLGRGRGGGAGGRLHACVRERER